MCLSAIPPKDKDKDVDIMSGTILFLFLLCLPGAYVLSTNIIFLES